MSYKFLDSIKQLKDYKVFPCERITLDYISSEPDQDENEVFNDNVIFETDTSGKVKNISTSPFFKSLIKYFLDGSRKVYKIAEIEANKRYLPIVCSQVGVACTERISKSLKKHQLTIKNVLVLPDTINQLHKDHLYKTYLEKEVQRIKIDTISEYKYSKKDNKKPLDLAIAEILKIMHIEEVKLIKSMTKTNLLDTNRMLIVDGSLQFGDGKKVEEENFRNVIGVSKSFNPHHMDILKDKKREIGTLLANLEFGERTPVYKFDYANVFIGTWYLKIRQNKMIKNPLDGVIKVEKIANSKDKEHINGFDSDEIDNISRCLLEERNVNCYGSDARWTTHLYPVYLTEQLLKKAFTSDKYFLNIF